ncbi:type I-E CRISPR-associated protein Cse1/CasA [Streptomyces albidoflavus]
MTPSFHLTTQPCIPVRTGDEAGSRLLSLRQVFVEAHHILDLALPMPPAQSGLLRLFTALTARLTGLDDPGLSRSAWTRRRRELLNTGTGFDPEKADAYFDAHVFDLFDAQRPFLQDPRLRTQCVKRAGVNALAWDRPAGNNLVWRSGGHSDLTPYPLPAHEAFWHLVIHHYYGASGRCSTRTVPGSTLPRDPGLTAGPLRSTLSFHPQGATLFETLLLHLTPCPDDPDDEDAWTPAADACPWEEDLPDPLAPLPPATWPGRLLTGRSRHALLLIPDADGSHVTDAYLTWAHAHPRQPAIDPHHIIDTQPGKDAAHRSRPRHAESARALWRDLDALLLAGDEHSASRRPAVFNTLNDLPPDVQARLTVRVCGFDQDPKVNNHLWYTALTPPVWNWAQEADPQAASRIAAARIAAESFAGLLAKHTKLAWQNTLNPHSAAKGRDCRWARLALAAYWPAAETTFWNLVRTEADDASIRPAFATTAATALRTATRNDLLRHAHAGPAVARALRALHAAATDRRTTGERRAR